MRIAAVVAVFVVLCSASLVGVVAPASGQTMPPPLPTNPPPLTPYPTETPNTCNSPACILPTATPLVPIPTSTPGGGCPDWCFPFPTPRPTVAPGEPVQPAQPDPGTGIWYYAFMPSVGRR